MPLESSQWLRRGLRGSNPGWSITSMQHPSSVTLTGITSEAGDLDSSAGCTLWQMVKTSQSLRCGTAHSRRSAAPTPAPAREMLCTGPTHSLTRPNQHLMLQLVETPVFRKKLRGASFPLRTSSAAGWRTSPTAGATSAYHWAGPA